MAWIAVALGGLATRGWGQVPEQSVSDQVQAVFHQSRPAVVKVEAADDHGKLSGTGFFIDPNGTILTSYTVAGESRDLVVISEEMKSPATRLLADPRSGIAILQIQGTRTPFLPLGSSRGLAPASIVMTVGFPMDLPLTPSFGMVSSFDIKFGDRFFSTAHIRTSVPVQRGEGGAPLLNLKGEVVGMLVSRIDYGAGCYALPVEAIEKIRSDFARFGEPRPGWIGIQVGESSEGAGGSSVEIQSLVSGAPAELAGLEKGDVLAELGNTKISRNEDVLNASFYITAGDETTLRIFRKGQPMEFKIRAGNHPSTPGSTAQNPAGFPGIGLPWR